MIVFVGDRRLAGKVKPMLSALSSSKLVMFLLRASGTEYKMAATQSIYVFRYGNSALYALTDDRSGYKLPVQIYPNGWQFQQTITLARDQRAGKLDLAKATLNAIRVHGFYLTHAALGGNPIAKLQDAG